MGMYGEAAKYVEKLTKVKEENEEPTRKVRGAERRMPAERETLYTRPSPTIENQSDEMFPIVVPENVMPKSPKRYLLKPPLHLDYPRDEVCESIGARILDYGEFCPM
jgi:hypothetical protein